MNERGAAPVALRAALLALATSASGCLGVAFTGNHYGSTSSPRIGSKPGQLIDGSGTHVVTADDVRRAWGEPDEVTQLGDGSESWTYVGGLRWNGVLLCIVIVPIPLFLPVGREAVTLRFRSGEAVFGDAIASEEEWSAFLGLHLHDGWTARAGGRTRSRIPDVDLGREPPR